MAKSKLDIIETLEPQTLIDMEISREEFNAFIREKKNMKGWKKMWIIPVCADPLKKKYGSK